MWLRTSKDGDVFEDIETPDTEVYREEMSESAGTAAMANLKKTLIFQKDVFDSKTYKFK